MPTTSEWGFEQEVSSAHPTTIAGLNNGECFRFAI